MRKVHQVFVKRCLLVAFGVSAAACGDSIPLGEDLDPVSQRSSALITGGPRTHGSNTQLEMPGKRLLADVNADGLTDIVQYTGFGIVVNRADYEHSRILSLPLDRPIKRVITGDFHHDGYDQLCASLDNGELRCFGIATDRKQLNWWFTQGTILSDSEDAIVGDFDGDAREDVLVYHRTSGAMRMYAVKGSSFLNPMPNFALGNLTGAPGGMQLRAGDFNGDGRDDIVAVNGAGQVLYYASVNDRGTNTFWWAFTTSAGTVGTSDQVIAARIDDDVKDDLVLRNRSTGQTRFFKMEYAAGSLPALTSVPIGQINVDANSQIFFGRFHSVPGEPGDARRDDALVFLNSSASLVRSDARHDGTKLTYWWAYTRNALPLPVLLRPQLTAQWCWAASAQMIMNQRGTQVTQCDQANKRLGRTDCCNSPVPDGCVKPGWPEFSKYGFSSNTTATGTALSFSDLTGQINTNKPVAFSWAWNGGGAHMMVAIGTWSSGGNSYVRVNDPWSPNVGDSRDILYSDYVSHTGSYSHLQDIYNIAP